jgi:hypothetical protein
MEFNSIDKRIRNGIPLLAILNAISEEDMNKLIDDIVELNLQLIQWRRGNLG